MHAECRGAKEWREPDETSYMRRVKAMIVRGVFVAAS